LPLGKSPALLPTPIPFPPRSFCPAHSPQQAVEATPEPDTKCLICLQPVGDRVTYNTKVCPACRTAWFHRDCIQGETLDAVVVSLKCPHCRNDLDFLIDGMLMGIPVPSRLTLTWLDKNAFAEQAQSHSHCSVRGCHSPGGREVAEHEPWEVLLCSSCAAEGTPRRCSSLTDSTSSWECGSC
ncbi:G2E3 ligase, partial [Cochlearius cochlearius]|nr:G2E3 ligase [Cochlearius cochlearius]